MLFSTVKAPPYDYLVQVLDHCPKAGSTYLALWKIEESNLVKIKKTDIRNTFKVTVARFRHDILLLSREGVVVIDETPKYIQIFLKNIECPISGNESP